MVDESDGRGVVRALQEIGVIVSSFLECRDCELAMCRRRRSLIPIIFPVDCCIFHSNTSVYEAWPEAMAMAIGLVCQCQIALFVIVCQLG